MAEETFCSVSSSFSFLLGSRSLYFLENAQAKIWVHVYVEHRAVQVLTVCTDDCT